jgi:hypothetical protein
VAQLSVGLARERLRIYAGRSPLLRRRGEGVGILYSYAAIFKAAPSPLRFAKQEASKELGIVEKARWAFNADCVSAIFNP